MSPSLIEAPPATGLPKYAAGLQAFHQAFARELGQAIADLPIESGMKVLDAPCGDGFFLRLLAERIGPTGRAVGLDISPAYLELARKACPMAELVEGDSYALPFPASSFDLVWCAQSLVSLDDPVRALRELHRVLRPGGLVAILENDEFHHVLLPWPVEVEAAILRALPAGEQQRFGRSAKLHAARTLRSLLRKTGFLPRRKRTFAADRAAPLDRATRRFAEYHLEKLGGLVRGRLDAAEERFEELVDLHSGRGLLDQADLELSYLFSLFVGAKSPHAR